MKFRLPKKLGEMYVYYDENNKPLYGFRVGGEGKIFRFVRLADELPEFIVLPKMNSKAFVPTEELGGYNLEVYGLSVAEDYAKGRIKLCHKCFEGIKNAKIVVTFNTSVMLDWGCFDDGAEIEFIVPKNIGLKHAQIRHDSGFDFEHEDGIILCDDRVFCKFSGHKDFCSVSDYTDKLNPYNAYFISKDYYVDEKSGEIIENSHTID